VWGGALRGGEITTPKIITLQRAENKQDSAAKWSDSLIGTDEGLSLPPVVILT